MFQTWHVQLSVKRWTVVAVPNSVLCGRQGWIFVIIPRYFDGEKFPFFEGFGKSLHIFNSTRVVVNSPLKDYILTEKPFPEEKPFPVRNIFPDRKDISVGKPFPVGKPFRVLGKPFRVVTFLSWETFPSWETLPSSEPISSWETFAYICNVSLLVDGNN